MNVVSAFMYLESFSSEAAASAASLSTFHACCEPSVFESSIPGFGVGVGMTGFVVLPESFVPHATRPNSKTLIIIASSTIVSPLSFLILIIFLQNIHA